MNSLKLKGKIIESGYNIEEIAKLINISGVTFRKKLKGESNFTVGESDKLRKELNLTYDELLDIFYR